MYTKVSMRPLERSELSEHEVKRCRAIAKHRPWDVWQEEILWWSPDRVSWAPLDDALWQVRRRCLLVQTEEGQLPAYVWIVGEGLDLPMPVSLEQPPVDAARAL